MAYSRKNNYILSRDKSRDILAVLFYCKSNRLDYELVRVERNDFRYLENRPDVIFCLDEKMRNVCLLFLGFFCKESLVSFDTLYNYSNTTPKKLPLPHPPKTNPSPPNSKNPSSKTSHPKSPTT